MLKTQTIVNTTPQIIRAKKMQNTIQDKISCKLRWKSFCLHLLSILQTRCISPDNYSFRNRFGRHGKSAENKYFRRKIHLVTQTQIRKTTRERRQKLRILLSWEYVWSPVQSLCKTYVKWEKTSKKAFAVNLNSELFPWYKKYTATNIYEKLSSF